MNQIIMQECYEYAIKKSKNNELPIACFVVQNNKIIAKSLNNKNIRNNVLGHCEILSINKASKKLKRWNLNDCELYVTLKPCEMCEWVIKNSHINKVYYLVDKLDYKKAYSKTTFQQAKGLDNEKKIYQEKLKKFFENKR